MIFTIDSTQARECIEITDRVRDAVRRSGVREGLCHVMALHATAAIVVNENADPNISTDLLRALDGAVPGRADWLHDRIDGNAQAHILASILGPSEVIAIEDGDLRLGTWQGILVVELDGPRRGRKIAVTIVASAAR